MGIGLVGELLINEGNGLAERVFQLEPEERIDVLNQIRRALHEVSPHNAEPVDLILWVPASEVMANDYNPNRVAPPEMRLLEHSVTLDGYTQPIVTWPHDGTREVVDGFHRHRVGTESESVRARVLGRLPVTTINPGRDGRNDRIAATIRHNRARGKHVVDDMSKIVVELKKRNWTDAKIGRELGMERDEVLRLAQMGGLAEMFASRQFSEAWE
jgi:ParB-like chromosome segregation protein Spo0J